VTSTSSSAPSAWRLRLLPFVDENLKIRRVSLFVRQEEILEKFRGIPSTLLSPSPQAHPLASEARILLVVGARYLSIRSVRGLLAGTMSTLPPYSTYRTDSKVSEHLCGHSCLFSCVCAVCRGNITAYLSKRIFP
jgi:hypothetical protein